MVSNLGKNDNLLKLRELSEKISSISNNEGNYEIVLKKLKSVVDEGKNKITDSKSAQSKIKCYEKMCTTITSILNNVNF